MSGFNEGSGKGIKAGEKGRENVHAFISLSVSSRSSSTGTHRIASIESATA